MTTGRFSRVLAGFIWRWRRVLSAFLLIGAGLSVPSANITNIDNDISAWFSREDPVYRDYERFRAEFGGTRTLIVALQADSPDRLFSRETLQFIERVTADIERVETVQRVESLATATIVEAIQPEGRSTHEGRLKPAPTGGRPSGGDGRSGGGGRLQPAQNDEDDGGLDVRPLIEDAATQPPGEVRQRALEDDLLRGDLVSESGSVTAIVVSFDEDRIDEVRGGVIQQIHELVDPRLPPGVRAFYNGSLEISETYNRITLDNQRKFTAPIFVLTMFAIYVAFRSWRKTALTMFAVLVSLLWTLGLYDLMGFQFNVLTSMLVPLVVVLAIADDVHIMQRWDEARRHGDAEHAFKETVAHLATPLFGASATTALGMLSLATSNVVAVRTFGIGSAVGIMVDFVISLVLVPTLLTLVKEEGELRDTPTEQHLIGPLRRIAYLSTTYPARTLSVALLVCTVAVGGILRLRVDTNHINFFAETHPLGESARLIDRELSGVYSFQLMLEGPPDSLNTPDALQRLDGLQGQLRRLPGVRKVTSVADYLKRINKELNDGREDANVIPADAATIAQELFVFTLGGEGRHELERVVASDYSRALVNVKLESMDSYRVLQYVEDTDRLAKQAFEGTGITVMTTGSGRLFSTLDHYLVDSQLSSFGTAFLTVFGVIFVVFRSWRFGALTILPNVLPVLAVLGVMGYLGISMNIATVMVASVALGVVDDDTIHFINRYRREVADGASTDAAIELATIHEGRASLTTAIINGCGFGVLFLSEYKPNSWFGGLLALTMVVAFLAEVFILPPLIKLLPRIFGAAALRRGPAVATAAVAVIALAVAAPASAQTVQRPTGHVSLFADWFPNRSDTTELRARIFAEQQLEPAANVRFTVSAFAEGLLAQRPVSFRSADRERRTDAILKAHEAVAEIRLGRFDLYAGYGRVVWGRLDELQPTDVINPLDISRFFFEGRNEARLPVALVRGRWYFSNDVSLEGVYVPVFRRGRFDLLDEPSSPFNIVPPFTAEVACVRAPCPPLPVPVEELEPPTRWGSGQGGARFTATIGRVDWSVAAYRGYEAFPLYEGRALPTPVSGSALEFGSKIQALTPAPIPDFSIQSRFPRFTMIGGDFESVIAGEWGIRGELAAFIDDNFQLGRPSIVAGRTIDAGLGVDRRAGTYQFSGTVLFHRELPDGSSIEPRSDVSVILSADRTFGRERYQVRAFSVLNPSEESAFVRGVGMARLRDDLAVEGSVGWLAGDGRDTIGRFGDSDFVYLRLKYYW